MLPLSLLYFFNIARREAPLETPSLPPWSSYRVAHMGQFHDRGDTQGEPLLDREHKLRRQREQYLQNIQSIDILPEYTLLPSKGLDSKTAHNLAFYGSPWQGGIKKTRSSDRTNVGKEDWTNHQGLVWINQDK